MLTTTLFLFLLLADTSAHPTARTLAVTNTSKAGIAGAGDASTDMAQFETTGKVSWYYTWGLDSVSDTDLQFVPMLWGQQDVAQWTDPSSGINATIAQRKPTAVLGFNEPQETGQSNLTPQEGAALWKQYIEPLRAQGLRLGSPAPSSAPSGKTWIQDFLTACDGGCTLDFIALHWYDVNATAFIDYINDFHNTFNLSIWVTEWSCQNYNGGPQCTASQISELLNTTQSYMNSVDWVERYSWFGILRDLEGVNSLDAMLTSSGKITNLGEQYIGAAGVQTSGASGSAGAGGAGATGLPALPSGTRYVFRSGWTTLLVLGVVACLL
uniref:Asl1-like glycosyl hydrolase catalytic domain-containing protein n=1 Tax=Mycena chlorophos TaxID=658473 RepID=A0ABQ0M5H3_MYCCL|nr:predicted protein [Mycena chlorophos]